MKALVSYLFHKIKWPGCPLLTLPCYPVWPAGLHHAGTGHSQSGFGTPSAYLYPSGQGQEKKSLSSGSVGRIPTHLGLPAFLRALPDYQRVTPVCRRQAYIKRRISYLLLSFVVTPRSTRGKSFNAKFISANVAIHPRTTAGSELDEMACSVFMDDKGPKVWG